MGYDLKAEILIPASVISSAGSVTDALTSAGFVYLERVKVSARDVVAGSREASQLEHVYRSRFHSALAPKARLRFGGVDHYIVRMDEIPRRRGWVLYTQTTPV